MIRRLRLKDWRAYHELDLELGSGTTFVVARNGVGKTSLIEGAAWALFGEAAGNPSGDAVRLGAATAIADVDVELPDGRMLSVRRPLLASTQRASSRSAKEKTRAPVTATVDGQVVQADQLDTLVRNAFSADSEFLARIVMLRGREQLPAPDALNLTRHLCAFFGIEGLQDAINELEAHIKDAEKRLRLIKREAHVSPAGLKALRMVADDRARESAAAELAHREAQAVARAADTTVRDAQSARSAASRESDRRARLAELAQAAAPVLGTEVPGESLAVALSDEHVRAERRLDAVRVERAALAGRADAIRVALAELDGTTGTCPVCRRPLSPEDSETARAEHTAELTALESAIADATETEQAEQAIQQRLRELLRTSDRLAPQPDSPPDDQAPLVTVEVAAEAASSAAAAEKQALDTLIARRAASDSARSLADGAEQDALGDKQAREQHTRAALAAAARDTIRATVNHLLTGTIAPLGDEVAARWKQLFGERGPVMLSDNLDVSRRVNNRDLPFSSFSTGEQVGLHLVFRLLVLNTATRARFCWVDEPLEHLDPAARRHVASLLAHATKKEGLRQILVTTYEEPLARRLASRSPGDVKIVYVRTAADL